MLNLKTKSITLSAIILGSSYFLSRVLGLLRDNLLANSFLKTETDIYFAAFRIPDLIFGILITGGIAAAFMPIFSDSHKEGKSKELASSVFTYFAVGLIILSAILFLLSPVLVDFIYKGEGSSQVLELTRIMFLSPILLGISAIFITILQYFGRILATALAPLMYNIGIIIGILWFSGRWGLKGLAYGVVLGSLLHLLIVLIPLCKIKYTPKFSFKRGLGLRRIFYLMIPRTVGATGYHLNLIILTAIASRLGDGVISVFAFSDNLQYAAVSLVGISYATASFPYLSRKFSENNIADFESKFLSIFKRILFLIVPLSVFVFLFRYHIVKILLGTSIGGESMLLDSQIMLTSASLGIFSFSMIFGALIPFLAKTFYSMKNTKSPVIVALVSFGVSIISALYFSNLLSNENSISDTFRTLFKLGEISPGALSLPIAITISSIINCILLIFLIRKKIKLREIIIPSFKIIIAGILSGFLIMFIKLLGLKLFWEAFLGFIVFLLIYLLISYILKLND